MCCLVGGRVRLGVSPEWSWGQVRWGIAVGGRCTACGQAHSRHASVGSVTQLGVSLTRVADLHA